MRKVTAMTVAWLVGISGAVIILTRDASAQTRPGQRIEVPQRLRHLTDLNLIDEPGLRFNRQQKTAVLLTWLLEEQRQPSPTTRGYGGPIYSGYIQEQIIRGLCVAHPYVIERLLASGIADERLRDALILVLGQMSDARQIPELQRILHASTEPSFRERAANQLGLLGAVEAIPLLEAALNDEFRLPEHSQGYYPIRLEAEIALRILRNPTTLEKLREESRTIFQTRLNWQAQDVFARKPCVELQRVTARLLSPGAKVNLVYSPASGQPSGKLVQAERAKKLVRSVVSSGSRRAVVASGSKSRKQKARAAKSTQRRIQKSSALLGLGALAAVAVFLCIRRPRRGPRAPETAGGGPR